MQSPFQFVGQRGAEQRKKSIYIPDSEIKSVTDVKAKLTDIQFCHKPI